MAHMLQFQSVSKTFPDGTKAVSNVTLDIPKGQFCVVLGPSGAGKSTLLRMINGLIRQYDGTILFDEIPVMKLYLKRIQRRVGMIHQQFYLVGRLNVLDNILCGVLPNVSTLRSLFKLFSSHDQSQACRLLQQVGLDQEHLYRKASELSGGQQQRVAIARAFMLNPDLILADEPVASLDPKTSEDILRLLKEASHERNTTVLCSLHQVELAKQFADRIIGMRDGSIVFDGAPSELDHVKLTSIYNQDELFEAGVSS